jgi:hypothetical protein
VQVHQPYDRRIVGPGRQAVKLAILFDQHVEMLGQIGSRVQFRLGSPQHLKRLGQAPGTDVATDGSGSAHGKA